VVEEALATHFGTAVPLRLVVDTGGAAGGPGPAVAGTTADDDVDPSDDGGTAPSAEARLLEAFPGAEEVTG
jgi:hypothetical protein